jgi:16S rRNA (cytosine1402-N4)-methyltransferase
LNPPHIPVLKEEIIDSFKETQDGYIVDCTVGYGGHSEALLSSNPNIKIICIDQDIEALNFSKERLKHYGSRAIFKKGRFSKVLEELKGYNIVGVLADIGVSSLQLDKRGRGFSFDSPTLDMRMDTSTDLTAYEVVNNYCIDDLERIFREYGEFREYKKLASLISDRRAKKPFKSSKELAIFISQHFKYSKNHPATLPFQAIRIEVNDELGELTRALGSIEKIDSVNLTVAIISFHSLEDRVVKAFFKRWSRNCICPEGAIRCECGNNNSKGLIITKKPIQPTKEEIEQNYRSRSSKLRIFRFTSRR